MMAVEIIDLLEVVEVQEQDRCTVGLRFVQHGRQRATIEDAGELIAIKQRVQFFLC